MLGGGIGWLGPFIDVVSFVLWKYKKGTLQINKTTRRHCQTVFPTLKTYQNQNERFASETHAAATFLAKS